MKVTSKIKGVHIASTQVGGLVRFEQVMQCSTCSNTLSITNSSSTPLPEEVVFKKARQAGWVPHRKGKHICDECFAKKTGNVKTEVHPSVRFGKPPIPVTICGQKFPSLLAAATATGVSVSTISKHLKNGTLAELEEKLTAGIASKRGGVMGPIKGKPVTINGVEYPSHSEAARVYGVTARAIAFALHDLDAFHERHKHKLKTQENEPVNQPEKPVTTPTREQRRAIYMKLDEVYDTLRGRYVDDWTDHKVSQALDMPRKWIADVRDDVFGPSGENDAMDDMVKELHQYREELKADGQACLEAAAKAEQTMKKVTELESRMADLRKAVGPHRVTA